LCYEMWGFSKQMIWKPSGICVFQDTTYEQWSGQPYFGILRKCSIFYTDHLFA